MEQIRTVHYVNQFLGQIGGEDKAGIPPQVIEGPVGVGQLIQSVSAGRLDVVATLVCGDNYAAENLEQTEQWVLEQVRQREPALFLAGPAFASGRHGAACGTFSRAVQKKLGIPALTGMHPANPGVELARKDVYILETGASARDMQRAVSQIVALALKLVDRSPVGGPCDEGYIPRGIRKNVLVEQRGSRRAVDMLLKKLRGEPFITELPLPSFDRVPPADAIQDLSKAVIALVTDGGVVPIGNPDRIEAHNASKYCRYFFGDLGDLTGEKFQTVHGGYDPTYVNEDPDRVLPLDAARLLESEGAFAKLFDYFYSTVGNVTAVSSAAAFGREIGEALRREGVNGVILTST